jgi:hypothetical protein
MTVARTREQMERVEENNPHVDKVVTECRQYTRCFVKKDRVQFFCKKKREKTNKTW